MRLSESHTLGLSESKIRMGVISEDGEAPRWKFDYDEYHNDPSPDILLLGAFEHPTTGNYLVGGINLHYLDKKLLDQLARTLPKVMDGKNLFDRYWNGRRLLPSIFKSYYRTYNAEFIRGVEQNVMYPKYGYIKTATNWLTNKISKIFKKDKDKEQIKYPNDLENMRTSLDATVADLQRRRVADSPEIRTAKRAYRQQQLLDKMRDSELLDTDTELMAQSNKDLKRKYEAERIGVQPQLTTDVVPDFDDTPMTPDDLPEPTEEPSRQDQTSDSTPSNRTRLRPKETRPEPPEEEYPSAEFDIEPEQYEPEQYEPEQYEPEQYEPEQYEPEQYEPKSVTMPSDRMAQSIDDTYEENQDELLDPDNELEESIIYYCPFEKRYIIETI